MNIDVNRNRALMVSLLGLRRVDERFTFFYHEANNIREFFRTQGIPHVAQHMNFVVGGIALREGQTLPRTASLHNALRLPPIAAELIFSDIGRGSFENILTSEKLEIVLSWLLKHDLLLHYSSINTILWSVEYIIDAILSDCEFSQWVVHHRILKNEFYRLVGGNKSGFLKVMKQHEYPYLQPGGTAAFLKDLSAFIGAFHLESGDMPLQMLDDLVTRAASLPEVAALVHKPDPVPVDEFKDIYLRCVTIFKNSRHVFNRELQQEISISDKKFVDGFRYVDVEFLTPTLEPGLQLAHIVTELMARYQCFVEEHTLAEMFSKKSVWTDEQRHRFDMLRDLIDRSDETSNAFIYRSTTQDSEWRNDTFMHSFPAAHAGL